MIKEDKYIEVIGDLMINYYDPHYEYKNRQYLKTFKNIESSLTAKDIIQWVDDNKTLNF